MTERKRTGKIVGVALAVYVFMKYVLPYVIPFLIAWILVRSLNPLLKKIRSRLPWKKEVVLSLLVFLVFLLVGAVAYALCEALLEQSCRILSNFEQYYAQAEGFLNHCCRLLEGRTGLKASSVHSLMERGMETMEEQISQKVIPGILNHSVQYLMGLVKGTGLIFMVYVAMILLMKDYEKMREDLETYEFYHGVRRVADRMFQIGGMYFRSQFLIMAIVTVICIAGLYLLKNSYALLFGLMVGLLDALPFLGTGTVLLPAAAVFCLQGKYVPAAGYAVLFLVTYAVREFLEPKLVGERIGIYPFVFALAVYAGFYLFGPAGIFTGPIGMILTMEIVREWMDSPGEIDGSKKN